MGYINVTHMYYYLLKLVHLNVMINRSGVNFITEQKTLQKNMSLAHEKKDRIICGLPNYLLN